MGVVADACALGGDVQHLLPRKKRRHVPKDGTTADENFLKKDDAIGELGPALLLACEAGNTIAVRLLLRARRRLLRGQEPWIERALLCAARLGWSEILAELLEFYLRVERPSNAVGTSSTSGVLTRTLHVAAERGHPVCIELLLAAGANTSGTSKCGPFSETAFLAAVRCSQVHCFSILFDATDSNERERELTLAFEIALCQPQKSNRLSAKGKLLEEDADLQTVVKRQSSVRRDKNRSTRSGKLSPDRVRKGEGGRSSVEISSPDPSDDVACGVQEGVCCTPASGQTIAALAALLHEVLPTTRFEDLLDEYGWSPLHFAAHNLRCHPDAISELVIETLADVNAASPAGHTALHLAVIANNVPAERVLLEFGADVVQQNAFDGNTVAHLAVLYDRIESFDIIFRFSGRLASQTKSGAKNVFPLVAREKNNFMLAKSVNLAGETPLHILCSNTALSHAEHFLSALLGVSTSEDRKKELLMARTRGRQWTPLHVAAASGNIRALEMIRNIIPHDFGQLLTGRSRLGQTCLHVASGSASSVSTSDRNTTMKVLAEKSISTSCGDNTATEKGVKTVDVCRFVLRHSRWDTVFLEDSKGQPACFVMCRDLDVVRLLVEEKELVTLSKRNSLGSNLVQHCVVEGASETLRYLLDLQSRRREAGQTACLQAYLKKRERGGDKFTNTSENGSVTGTEESRLVSANAVASLQQLLRNKFFKRDGEHRLKTCATCGKRHLLFLQDHVEKNDPTTSNSEQGQRTLGASSFSSKRNEMPPHEMARVLGKQDIFGLFSVPKRPRVVAVFGAERSLVLHLPPDAGPAVRTLHVAWRMSRSSPWNEEIMKGDLESDEDGFWHRGEVLLPQPADPDSTPPHCCLVCVQLNVNVMQAATLMDTVFVRLTSSNDVGNSEKTIVRITWSKEEIEAQSCGHATL
ncbi:unnamed protein product [Amoebophrya sp. A25]|nr:unnamed protein product [Amoebophrya sp. A25]|eukprot:GSA25T00015283001.1